jgi:hypothetical protein
MIEGQLRRGTEEGYSERAPFWTRWGGQMRLYGGQGHFRNGGGEGVCNAWEEDGEVELVGGFCIHVLMKQKLGFFLCDGLYLL